LLERPVEVVVVARRGQQLDLHLVVDVGDLRNAEGVTYKAVVSTGAKDVAGNPIAQQ
jgi:hypothetical protein